MDGILPPSLTLPPDFEILSAVKRLALSDLLEGMESFLVIISDPNSKRTTKNAMNYICGAGWGIKEQENPDHEFHPTARRIRNAKRDTNSPEWDGDAFGDATPEERQKILAENIAKQKRKSQ